MSALRDGLTEAVAALKAELAAEQERGVRGESESSLLEDLSLIGELQRLSGAAGARRAGELARRESEEAAIAMPHGWRTLPDLVSFEAGVPLSTAQSWYTVGAAVTPRTSLLGETLPAERPRVGEALDEGVLTVEAAAIIARTLNGLEEHSSLEERELAEGLLVQQAQELTLRQLGRLCIQLRDRFYPDGIEPREDLLRRKSGLRRIIRPDGSPRYILDPDPESDAILKAAIDARTAPRRRVRFEGETDPTLDPATADDRTFSQRQLHALVDIARESLARDDGELAGMPVTMLVTVSLETLKTGIGSASIAGIDTPISAATARRLACQANIIPIVLGGESEILDVGRVKRLFTTGQRLAMAVRDRGCTWPGCEAPPGWCEAAHRNPWHAGGKTRLEDGILLCPYHHRRFDNDGWGFELRGGIPYFIPPPHVDPSRTPRRGGRERLPQNLAG